MATILIVEDEPDAAALLVFHLRAAGHDPSVAEDGAKGLRVARTTRPDLILLDHMLPSMSGMDICRALRAEPATTDIPVIMLTARADEADRVRGLECGADDYVTKPFSMRELMLRIERHLQRRAPVKSAGSLLTTGRLSLNLDDHTVGVDGETVRLTSTETKLLTVLMRAAGQTLTRAQLLTDVWQYNETSDTRTVDTHIKRLRAKLGGAASCVETVPGVGYRLAGE